MVVYISIASIDVATVRGGNVFVIFIYTHITNLLNWRLFRRQFVEGKDQCFLYNQL